jgi:hypothetical protein
MPLVKKWQLDEHAATPDVHGDTKVRSKEVDETNIGDGKILVYRSALDKLVYETPAAGVTKVTLAIDETEVSVTGTTEMVFSPVDKTFDFVKDSTHLNLSSLKVILQMKVTAPYTGTIKIYLDSEASPRLTFTTTSSSYELKSGTIDISTIAAGLHTLTVKGYTNNAAATVYLRFYQVLGVE